MSFVPTALRIARGTRPAAAAIAAAVACNPSNRGGSVADRIEAQAASAPAQAWSGSSPNATIRPVATDRGSLVYFGRFAAQLPPNVIAVVGGGTIRDLGVREAGWAAGGVYRGPFRQGGPAEAAWAARLATLRADPNKRPADKPDVVILERQLAPDLRIMFRHDGKYNPRLLATEALLDAGDHGVWIDAPYQPGAEAEALRLVPQIARSYHPYPATGTRSEGIEPSFHLTHGAFDLAPSEDESVVLNVNARSAGLENLTIRSSSDTDSAWGRGLIAQMRGMLENRTGTQSFGVQGSFVRAGTRRVAGMDGEEVIVRLGAPGERSHLGFEWECPGRDNSPSTPQLHIKAEADMDRGSEAGAIAAWNAVLDGLRAVPQGTPGGPT